MMARSWTAAVVVCAATAAAATPAASPLLDLVVQPDGVGFHITVNGGFWLASEPVFVQAGVQLLKAGNGLTLLNHSGPTPGTDPVLGGFVEYTWVWTASGAVKLRMVTSARVFTTHPTINFTQSFPDGVDSFGFGKLGPVVWGRPATGWPSLRASTSLAKTLEYARPSSMFVPSCNLEDTAGIESTSRAHQRALMTPSRILFFVFFLSPRATLILCLMFNMRIFNEIRR